LQGEASIKDDEGSKDMDMLEAGNNEDVGQKVKV
jgi:hypothetical protein